MNPPEPTKNVDIDNIKAKQRHCSNHVGRYCHNMIDVNDPNKQCSKCREKYRKKDKAAYASKNSTTSATSETETRCGFCCRVYNNTYFIAANGKVSKKCEKCRENDRVYDRARRANEHDNNNYSNNSSGDSDNSSVQNNDEKETYKEDKGPNINGEKKLIHITIPNKNTNEKMIK
jgi:hypothetical protein